MSEIIDATSNEPSREVLIERGNNLAAYFESDPPLPREDETARPSPIKQAVQQLSAKESGSKILGYEREKFKPQEFLEINFTKAPLDEVDNPYGLDKRFVTYEAPNGFAYWTDFPYGGYGKYSERTFLDILKAIDAARHIPIYAPTKKNN